MTYNNNIINLPEINSDRLGKSTNQSNHKREKQTNQKNNGMVKYTKYNEVFEQFILHIQI